LKPASRATWAKIIATELLDQLDITVHNPVATLNARFRWEGLAAFARYFKSKAGRRDCALSWTWHALLSFEAEAFARPSVQSQLNIDRLYR